MKKDDICVVVFTPGMVGTARQSVRRLHELPWFVDSDEIEGG